MITLHVFKFDDSRKFGVSHVWTGDRGETHFDGLDVQFDNIDQVGKWVRERGGSMGGFIQTRTNDRIREAHIVSFDPFDAKPVVDLDDLPVVDSYERRFVTLGQADW